MRILMYNSKEIMDSEVLSLLNRCALRIFSQTPWVCKLLRFSKSLISAGIIASFVISSVSFSSVFADETAAADSSGTDSTSSSNTISITTVPTVAADMSADTVLLDPTGTGAPSIDGSAYVLYDVESGVFLLGKNPDEPLSPASITKVMTILLALENLKLTDVIVVTRDMYESIPNDYQRLGLVEGEEITVEEAIYASLLISACDASMALAIAVGGSVDGFADMMNKRAVELGCTHTNFTNPYGISDENHLTTAHDMALIMSAALKQDTYRKISTTADYTMPATNKFSDTRSLANGNRFVSTTKYAYDKYIGGKTGFTDLSAYTIAAGAKQDDQTLIGVILGSPNAEIRYPQLISLFEYGFSTYSTAAIDPKEYTTLAQQAIDQVTSSIANSGYKLSVTDSALSLIPYCTTTSARAEGGYISSIDVSQAVIKSDLPQQVLTLPVYRQYSDGSKDQVGSFAITICDAKASLTTSHAGTTKSKPDRGNSLLRTGIIILLVVILAFCIIVFVMLHRENKRRRNCRRPRVL